jgi:gas vesicle protein
MSMQNEGSGGGFSQPGADDFESAASTGEEQITGSADGGTATSIKEKARQTKERVFNKGTDAVNQAKERTRTMADDRKNQLGERIHGYGSAVRRAADKLRDEKDPNIAHYADMVAERLDRAADYVQARDPGMILRDVENAARRRPEIFFGGMFLAGLVISRFLKASAQRDDSYTAESDEEYWVEDESQGDVEDEYSHEQQEDNAPIDPNFAMTSGEAAGDWRLRNEPGANS